MNFGFLFLFLLVQVVVNYVLRLLLASILTNIYGLLVYYLLSSLIISFIAGIFSTPPGYRKDFYKQPGFHKIMLTYFLVFLALDLIFMLF